MKKRIKKILSIMLVIIVVSTVIVPVNVSASTQTGIVKVDSYLNVRSDASTDSTILGKLANNETVTIIDTIQSGGVKWYKIQYAGSNGYVSAEYITLISSDTTFEQYLTLQGFPESYKDGLRALHAEYPEWVFVAQHITPDWNTVIKNESKVGNNLVPASSPAEQKSFEKDAFNWDKNTWYGLDGSWVAASEQIVCWAMDPRNFLDKKYIFQFEKLNYVSSHTLAGINNIIKGTFMANGYPDDEFDSFAEAIMAAATEAYIEKLGLVSIIDRYIHDNDIDYNDARIIDLINDLETCKAELLLREDDYAKILVQNATYFINSVERMRTAATYAEQKKYFEEAAALYFYLDVSVEGAARAVEIYDEYKIKLQNIEESSLKFIEAVAIYNACETDDDKYAALVECYYNAQFVEMSYEGAEEAMAEYQAAYEAYMNYVNGVNEDIVESGNVTGSFASASGIVTVIAVIIKKIFGI